MAGELHYRFDSDVPVIAECDVLVVGGGPGGIGAAVTAARRGVKVMLLERYSRLGGMAVYGEVHPFMPNHIDDISLDRPVFTDWVEQAGRHIPTQGGRAVFIHKDIASIAAEELCMEAGVHLLYHHTLVDVLTSDEHVGAAIVHSKSGFGAVRAKQFVDCSGDADLAFLAGCECEMGNSEGQCQPMTLNFKLSHVDRDSLPDRATMTAAYVKAKEQGRIDCPRENILTFNWFDPTVVHFNTTRIIGKSAVDGVSLSEAEIEGRRQLMQITTFLKETFPAFANARLLSMGHHIGVRESRRVRGLAYLQTESFETCQKFDDAIARINYPIDIHNPSGTGTRMLHLPPGEWYEVPFGCVVARDMDNLLVGGRPISVDHAVHSSSRVMPPACTLGQAAGMGAALAVQGDRSPRELDGEEVRGALVEVGAPLAQ